MTRILPPDVVAAARTSQARWDIPASVCLAQWALESAWGSAMPPGSNNPFGIKAVGSQRSVAAATHEVVKGRTIAATARFRAFASVAEAFAAHAELLATGSPYAKARQVRHDPEAFAAALTGVYATDPHYGDKLIALMRTCGLRAFDEPADPPAASRPPAVPVAEAPPPRLTWFERLVVALTFRKAA